MKLWNEDVPEFPSFARKRMIETYKLLVSTCLFYGDQVVERRVLSPDSSSDTGCSTTAMSLATGATHGDQPGISNQATASARP